MKMMATYGTTEEKSDTTRFLESEKKKVTFKYTEIFHNHFQGRHAVDDNNKLCMKPISLEETWETIAWENRVFAFFMATSAANAQYAHQYFGQNKKESVLVFCQKMAYDLIYNKWVPSEHQDHQGKEIRMWKQKKTHHCELLTLPLFKTFSGAEIVSCNGKYNRKRCFCGKIRTRTYCKCTPGVHRCPECYASHCEMVANANYRDEPNLAKI